MAIVRVKPTYCDRFVHNYETKRNFEYPTVDVFGVDRGDVSFIGRYRFVSAEMTPNDFKRSVPKRQYIMFRWEKINNVFLRARIITVYYHAFYAVLANFSRNFEK